MLGPNGAGKSTTFKMMCGLLVPTSGQPPSVLDMDLKSETGQARHHLGYRPKNFHCTAKSDRRAEPDLLLRGLRPARQASGR
nr:ATP-binding cassette domain-containing protein [Edwardsiella ictaluri]